jgi:DNA-binding NarL/FixJ family response regulator
MERRVLGLMATGLSSRDVAGRLNMPVEQVRDVAYAAIVKLGARSKLEAIIIAIRRRLIDSAGT